MFLREGISCFLTLHILAGNNTYVIMGWLLFTCRVVFCILLQVVGIITLPYIYGKVHFNSRFPRNSMVLILKKCKRA